MSPELLRLLEARYERDTSEPAHLGQREATYRRLFNDALGRRPVGISRDEFQFALDERYWEFRRVRRKNAYMPPKA